MKSFIICLFVYLFICLLFSLPSVYADQAPPVNTAFGVIDTTPGGFVGNLFSIILGTAGTGAVGLIIYGGYTFAMSKGNQEKTKEAQEILTSAVVGLLFVIFSAILLRIIGLDILGFKYIAN